MTSKQVLNEKVADIFSQVARLVDLGESKGMDVGKMDIYHLVSGVCALLKKKEVVTDAVLPLVPEVMPLIADIEVEEPAEVTSWRSNVIELKDWRRV